MSTNKTNAAIKRLQRIQQLWVEVGRTRLDTPEYQKLMAEIRRLSAEYQKMLDAAKKED